MDVVAVAALSDNYIWLIIDKRNRTAICVDPGEAQPVINFLQQEKLALQAILLTHHHYDHVGGVAALLNKMPGIEVYGPNDSRIAELTMPLQENSVLSLLGCNFHILSTPGHTATHVCIYEPKQGWLFCGDTLFSAGCGRVFDGTLEDLYQSLQKLQKLPDNTKVYCAHEYTRKNLRFASTVEPDNMAIKEHIKRLPEASACSLPSTIGLEKKINPFFRTEEEKLKKYAHLRGQEKVDSLSVFKQLREDKDNFS